jgi:protoporphyrinogen oxidase
VTSGGRRIGIVGGGVAGLAAAYRLLQRGHQVHLVEASPQLGGLVRSFEIGGGRIECFYHHLFTTDTTVIRLIDELGCGDQMVWRESSLGIFYKDRIYPFVTPVDLLRFTPVSIVDRVRLGLMGLYLRSQKDGTRYERVAVKDWITRFAGRRNYEVVWGPLFRGKFGDLGDRIAMIWLWNKIRLRFSSRKAGPMQKEVLGYLQGSFGVYIDVLIERIRELGGVLEGGRPVQRIVAENGRAVALEVGGDHTETIPFDVIIATVANKIFRRIAPPLPDEYASKLEGVPYQDAMCLVLALDRQVSPTYWLNINDRSVPFLALIEQTNFIEPERYGGKHVLYFSNYLDKSSPLLQMNTNEVWELYKPHVKRINPEFREDWVTDRWLFKGPDAQPVFTVDSPGRVPEHRTPVDGLYLANMSQIYPEDRGQNYSIRMGEQVAEMVADDLAGHPDTVSREGLAS